LQSAESNPLDMSGIVAALFEHGFFF